MSTQNESDPQALTLTGGRSLQGARLAPTRVVVPFQTRPISAMDANEVIPRASTDKRGRTVALPGAFTAWPGWVRRRLRAAMWRQWKTQRRRRAMLNQLGVRGALAEKTAASSRGPWHLAHSKALSIALSNAYFHSRGFPSLLGRC